eukprot:c19704_g1_i1.p1 GENE.c19704_g1_i1~~c19704_g1_i1.p1  ORF type:complete len:123 (-),score=13.93 c19704_g1_i1:578-946(-)
MSNQSRSIFALPPFVNLVWFLNCELGSLTFRFICLLFLSLLHERKSPKYSFNQRALFHNHIRLPQTNKLTPLQPHLFIFFSSFVFLQKCISFDHVFLKINKFEKQCSINRMHKTICPILCLL